MRSGTQDETLAAHEQAEVANWNNKYVEEGGWCRYVRRMRTVLYKYGQVGAKRNSVACLTVSCPPLQYITA
jgi:hypothetical protein